MGEHKTSLVADPDEKPLLVIAGGWPRDLLSWVFAIPPLLYLGAIAAGFAGFSTFVLLLLITADPVVATFLGAPVAVFTWYWWARDHFGVTNERIEFYDRGIVAFLKDGTDGKTQRHDLRFEDFGSVLLDVKRATIRFRFAMPHPGQRSNFLITLPRLTARDQFDQILEWIEAQNPDHLFLHESDETREYSREFVLDDIFPGARDVVGAIVLANVDNNTRFELGGRRYEFVHDGFGKVRVLRDGTDHILSGISALATPAPSVRILGKKGLEFARCVLTLTDDHAVIEFGYAPPIRWHVPSGELIIDQQRIGSTSKRGEDLAIELTQPLPEPTALTLLVVISFLPQMSFVEPAAAQSATQ